VDPVPDPLLLRKSGSAGNRTRTSGSIARNFDHKTTEAVYFLLHNIYKFSLHFTGNTIHLRSVARNSRPQRQSSFFYITYIRVYIYIYSARAHRKHNASPFCSQEL
jgi:hypothetical protein